MRFEVGDVYCFFDDVCEVLFVGDEECGEYVCVLSVVVYGVSVD